MGEILEVLGAKVASILKEQGDELDCVVVGKDKKIVKRIAAIFSCSAGNGEIEDGFDLEIVLGKNFVRRF